MTNVISRIPIWLLLSLFALSHTTEPVCTAALPLIAHNFDVSSNIAQLSSSIYFAGFSLGILSLGRISDVFGRRPVALAGLTVYLISSVACSFAQDINTLLALRFTQAFGVSVGSVIAQAMARDSYQGNELSKVYVSISICLSFVPSLGSIAGGYIVEYTSWQYNFRFLSMLAAILLFTCVYRLPETNRYMLIARTHRYRAVLKSILSDRVVLLYALIVGSFNGMMFGFYVEAPFIFIKHFHFTPSDYGKLGFLLTFAYLVGGLINRYLVSRYIDNKKIITTGLCLSLFSCTILFLGLWFTPEDCKGLTIVLIIFVPMMVHVIGHNLTIPFILRYALEDYSKVTGTAGSIFGCLYYSFVAIINYTISCIHGTSAIPFAALFLTLSGASFLAFMLIQKYSKRTSNDSPPPYKLLEM
ncbi:MAG: multidrug effflux MFS transporter [Pseudomonadota bacterium]